MQKKLAGKLLGLAAALLLLLGACALNAGAQEVKPIRVGLFSLGQFMGWDETGEACGYQVDYLNRIAEVTHWTYEFVDCQNWENAKDMLEAGQIDLLAPAQRTARLVDRFDFCGISMGLEATAIYTTADRDDLLFEDFASMKNLTYGIPEGTVFETEFVEDYSTAHGLTPKIVKYANTTEILAALHRHEIDAAVTNIMFAAEDVKMLGWYSPAPIYFITAKGDQELLNQLDDAMVEIMVEEPDYMAQLESQYFPIFHNAQFTYEEQQYLQSLPTVTVGYEVNHKPLSYQDAETGEFCGITRDILDKISQISGIQFQYEPLPATNVSYDYLVEHQIYVLSNVEYNSENLAIRKMHLSEPYLKSEKVLVASEKLQFDAQTHLRVALATGSGTLTKVIQTEYPAFDVSTYGTVDECFEAIRSGAVDATIQNRYVASCALENPLYSALAVSPIQLLSDQLCLATMQADDSALCQQLNSEQFRSIIDKSISRINNVELNNIIIENTTNTHYHLTLWDVVRKYAGVLLAVGALVLICLALLLRTQHITAAKNRELAAKNAQLAEAVAQADRASTAKSRFLSQMSHEIRTPMNAIVGLTAIAKKHEGDPGKTDDYLTKIETSSKVLLNIINDVLDMSAIESNKLKISNGEFDIKQVLNSLTTIYYPQCQAKGIRFEMATDLENEMLIGDSLRVSQVLLNLVSNAYKFTDKGGSIRVVAQETARRDRTAFLRFTVADTGIGMSPEMQARLFKPFEQETADTAKKHGGSGLGLSIAKNLVDMMHGVIRVESEKGKGTTFFVDLPFEVTNQSTVMSNDVLHSVRILAIDDDQEARAYTAIVLRRIGAPFEMAASGTQAMEMIARAEQEGNPYNVVLADWKMPDMDGVELTRQIRAREKKRALIIIVSAYDLNAVEEEAKAAGADHFVSKPLFQSTVFNVLMTLTQGQLRTESAKPDDYDFTGHKVLLAEDNEMNAEIAAELLGMVHLQVDRAENGQRAVELFCANPPGSYDAILMDVQMPVMDGYSAARAIRALKRPDAAQIKIFAMTANAFTEDISTALSAGMNGHIAKPIDTQVLYETLAKAMGMR